MRKLQIGVISASIFLLSLFFSNQTFATSGSNYHGGSGSDNDIEIQESHEMNVTQENDTDISNQISVSNSTGGNTVSGNTRGDVEVNTGDANATVTIENTAGMNSATISGHDMNNLFSIRGNGYRSDNSISYEANHRTNITQSNDTSINNNVEISNDTGNNHVRGSNGDTTIQTGDADATVAITNTAGLNSLQMNGGESHNTQARIDSNGSRSDNRIEFDMNHKTDVNQHNDTNINNRVAVDNNTGNNSVRGDHHNSDYNHDCDQHNTYRNCDDHDYDRDDQRNCDSYKPMKYERECDCNKKHAKLSWYKRNNNWMRYPRNNHNSGNNSSGDVSVRSGNANATITLTNTAGLNWLSI